MPSDKVIKAMFGQATDVSGKTQFQTGGKIIKKKKKKQGYTRIQQIMDTFGVGESDAQIWAGGGYSDADIKKFVAERKE